MKHIFPLAAALFFFAFLPVAFGQTAEGGEAKAKNIKTLTLWEQILHGGWVMVPIGICSVFTLYLIGDGVMRTARNKMVPEEHLTALRNYFRAGDYAGAYRFATGGLSPLNNVVRVGLSLIGEGKAVAEEGMLAQIAKENSYIQTRISYLSVIGVCTPMIGLLGTVVGMIKAFATLGSAGIGDPSALSAAIGEVLVATASGLFIAIPAFGAFYFLRNRAAGSLHYLQDALNGLFRRMPYETLANVHLGDEEIYAAKPNWVT